MGSVQPPSIDAEQGADFAEVITRTMTTLFSAQGVTETVGQVIALSMTTIEGCDYAGILVMEGDEVTTPYGTDPLVIELEALQKTVGEGPCLDAMSQSAPFYAEEFASDARWPRFGPMAREKGVHSVLALPLLLNGAPAALNLYGRQPQAFGIIDRGRGLFLAAMAELAFSSAQTLEDEERRTANLHAALATREMIGQAQGILMERERMTSDQAFDLLRRASQHLNVKLRDVAQNLIDTGERPETGRRPETGQRPDAG
jgi:hypothetical protein